MTSLFFFEAFHWQRRKHYFFRHLYDEELNGVNDSENIHDTVNSFPVSGGGGSCHKNPQCTLFHVRVRTYLTIYHSSYIYIASLTFVDAGFLFRNLEDVLNHLLLFVGATESLFFGKST